MKEPEALRRSLAGGRDRSSTRWLRITTPRGHPDGVYQALEDAAGPLAGKLVLEGGAGTGIATRQLAARGTRIVAVDIAERASPGCGWRGGGSISHRWR